MVLWKKAIVFMKDCCPMTFYQIEGVDGDNIKNEALVISI